MATLVAKSQLHLIGSKGFLAGYFRKETRHTSRCSNLHPIPLSSPHPRNEGNDTHINDVIMSYFSPYKITTLQHAKYAGPKDKGDKLQGSFRIFWVMRGLAKLRPTVDFKKRVGDIPEVMDVS